MTVTLDRFEGEWAVLVDADGETTPVERTRVPADAREGDRLTALEDGTYAVDEADTAARRARILALQNKLRGK